MASPINYIDDLGEIDFIELVATLEADSFSNGRTPEELRQSCANSYANVFARSGGSTIGMARLLSDGVCNAYLVDVWTLTAFRARGIASAMVTRLLEAVPGQHIALFTDGAEGLYLKLGFRREEVGMSQVRVPWLRH